MTAVVEQSEVIDLLAAEFAALMTGDLAKVQVFTEATTAAEFSPLALSIGDPADDDQEPVEVTYAELGLARKPEITYSVACIAWAYSGALTVDDQRAQASAIVKAVRVGLAADPTLGGRVARARLGRDMRWGQVEDAGREDDDTAAGGAVVCAFTVEVLVLP